VPTYELPRSALAEYEKLSRQQRRAFRRALREFVAALRHKPPEFPPRLRVKRVQGHSGVWEFSFAPDGRATFEYGAEQVPGEPHVIWRRIGSHDILREP
jgi:hypothetical protein